MSEECSQTEDDFTFTRPSKKKAFLMGHTNRSQEARAREIAAYILWLTSWSQDTAETLNLALSLLEEWDAIQATAPRYKS